MSEDRAGRALFDSEERYQSVVRAMTEGVILQDADSVILACNEAAERLLGLTAAQMMGRTSMDPRWRSIHEDGSPFPGEMHPVPVTLRTGQPQRDVVMGVHKPDGTLTWLSVNSEPLFREGETRPYAAACTFNDITQRKLAENALRSSEERYRRILETTLEGVWKIDLDGKTTFANQRMAEMLGCTIEELQHSTVWDFIDDADRELVTQRLAARGRGIGELHEIRLRRKDGSFVWTSMATSPITSGDGTKGAVAMVRDITEARRMQDELHDSQQRLELALSAGQLGTWEWTVGSDRVEISPQVREILGVVGESSLDNRSVYDRHVHPDDRDELRAKLKRHLESGSTDRLVADYRIVRPDGTTRWLHACGRVIRGEAGETRILGTVNDVTESRELEAQLQEARQLEVIGRLAGGIAHDFNNLLTAILASVGFAEAAKPPGIAGDLRTIRTAAERGADLTRQLLAFARKQVIQLQTLDLNAILEQVGSVLRRLVGEDIELMIRLGRELWPVRGDASQLEQVIVNLVANGREAMPGGGGLVIETSNLVVDHDNAHRHREVPLGEYVTLTVTDAGCGIDPSVLPHIFEPFYSTKPSGTGLGLASSYGIAKQLGGHIRVHSERGHGSTFTVYLPRDREAIQPSAPVLPPLAATRRPSSTILLVEDDDLLRRVVVRGLADAGYDALVASDGDQALELAAAHQGPIHALITDVVMPRISGRQLADRLRAIRPETKVLFVSGYTDQIIARQGVLEPGQKFLAKPYTIETLAQRIDELIGEE